MGWLLELLVEGIREMLSQFVIDMMTLVTDMFTELLSCDLSLFEELFSVVGDLYKNVVLPMGIALLLLICVWQLFKSMFGKAGVASEDPIELVCRTGISLFFIVAAKPLVDYILAVAGTPYQWITGTDVEVSSFSEYVSVLEGLTGGLGIDSLNIAILMLIMQFVVAWNYFKMLFVIAERYVLLGVFSYTAPLAFGTGGSKATNNILASWAKMFGGQIILILLNSWCLKMFLSGYGNLNASAYGFTKFFVATLCLVGFCKVTFKLDSYLSSLGVNLGRPTTGIGALGLMMAAGRVLSHVGRGSGESSGSSSPTGTESQTVATDGAGMTDAAPGPIPMGFPGDSDAMRMDGENEFSGATTDETADMELANGDFDTMDDEQGSVLEEMGMMPQDSFAETEDGMMDILFLGSYIGRQNDSLNFIIWSIILWMFGIGYSYHLLRCGEKKDYETIEGTVCEIKGKRIPGRVYKVVVCLSDGKQTILMMDKKQRFEIGKKYRFYFNKKTQGVLFGIQKLDAALNVGSYYGAEEIE